jgi:hypothetical protein
METGWCCILLLPTQVHHPKTTLMLSRVFITRCLILGFMVLVGYSMAKSIQAGSPLALILSVVSLGSGIYFVYLLKKLNEQEETA